MYGDPDMLYVLSLIKPHHFWYAIFRGIPDQQAFR